MLVKAIVFLAQRGIDAQHRAERELKENYDRLINEQDPQKKPAARKELIRAVFGSDAFATDQVR